MSTLIPVSYYQNLANEKQLVTALETLKEVLQKRATSLDSEVAESIRHLVTIINDANAGLNTEDITEISKLGIQLLETLYFETRKTVDLQTLFNYISLAFTYWVARKGGVITQLQFPVNALAQAANTLHDKVSLESLYEAATFIISQTAESIINDPETAAPGNPWKVLIINYGIIATRTHTPELMESAYQALIKYYPNELPGFFTQAMSEMTRLNYPSHVRSVVERYHQRYTL